MKAVSFGRLPRAGMIFLVMLVSFLIAAACGTGAAPEVGVAPETTAAPETSTVPETTVGKEVATSEEIQEKALRNCPEPVGAFTQDTKSYAEAYGLSYEEAVRRMRLSECFSRDLTDLERELMRKERDSFAGFWLEHEPEYRFVFLFTEDGRKKIRPYIKDEPYAPLLEVRSYAEATLAELNAAQKKADRIVDRLDIPADSTIDIKKNRAMVFVTDRNKFEAELRKAGMRLPEHVVLIEVEGLSRPTIPE